MSKSRRSFESIVDGGADVWRLCSRWELHDAFGRSGAAAAAVLPRFLTDVNIWVNAANPQSDRDELERRNTWRSTELAGFLEMISAEQWRALFSTGHDLEQGCWLVETLARAADASLVHKAARAFELQLRAASPARTEANDLWGAFVCRVIEIRVRTLSPNYAVRSLAEFFDGLGVHALAAPLRRLNTFKAFQRCARALGLALALVPEASVAFGRVWQERSSDALVRILWLLGLEVADPGRLEHGPDAGQILTFVGQFVADLHLRDPEQAAQASAWFDSACRSREEAAGLFTAYLNAAPANHEDVIEFLSTDRSERIERIEQGHRSGVSITESHSMRIGRGANTKTRLFENPDFDRYAALRGLDVVAAVRICTAQPVPEYFLDYLEWIRIAEHPKLDEIVGRTLRDVRILAGIRGAQGLTAVQVLTHLRGMISAAAARDVASEVFPLLLPRVPDGNIANEDIRSLARRLQRERTYWRDVLRRIRSATSLKSLLDLACAGSFTGCDLAPFTRRVAIDPFLREIQDPSGADAWFDPLVRLASDTPALVERILAALDADAVFRMYDEQSGFTFAGGEDVFTVQLRLVFKLMVAGRMNRLDRARAEAGFRANFERDFFQWFAAGPSYVGEPEHALGHWRVQWLELVAVPALVAGYLTSLVYHAPMRHDRFPQLMASLEFVLDWQRRNGGFDEQDVRDTLLRRLRDANAAGKDIAATVRDINHVLVGFKRDPLAPLEA